MKHIIFIAAFFLTAITFAQNTGAITGNLLDLESNNEPLLYAKVTVKETGASVLSDENGFFKIENLKEGTYTLVYSFIGYDTKEIQAEVSSSKPTNITLHLAASTISLDELVFALASNEEKATATSNN
jgi:transcriptional regulator of nitric oxide reductase